MAFELSFTRLFCQRKGSGGDYCVAIRDGKLILALPDDNDITQLWYKDERENDNYMLVNKATDKVVKYSDVGVQLELVNKPSSGVDQSVLWTDNSVSPPIDGLTNIRTSSNHGLVMDAWEGHISEGTLVSIYPNANSDNEYWKFVPYYSTPIYKLYCKRQGPDGDYCVSVRDGKLVLALPNDNDTTQVWYKDNYDIGFSLVNKATGNHVQHSGVGVQLQLVTKPNNRDQSILWTASEDEGNGYTYIRTANDVGIVMDAWEGHINDGTLVSVYPNANSDNEDWKFVLYSPPI